MKSYHLNLIRNDSIQVQIQKEEIDKIIQLQKGKELVKEPKMNL
jgi:hypothetical protein